MKIYAAGLVTETNTFSPLPTALEDFRVQRGSDARAGHTEHPSLDLTRTWGAQAASLGAEFHFGLMAWAEPAGITVRHAYEALRDEILDELRASMPVDVLLLHLHGAMVADGYDDCEEDVIRRAREMVGPHAVIAVEFDLHCHLSETKISVADIVLTYKEYPHSDINERAGELFTLAVRTHRGEIRPTMALFDCRMVGMYPTSRPPLRGLVDAMLESERERGVLSISLGHGFQFADLPHVGAKVLAVTDNNQPQAQVLARRWGVKFYELRHQVGFDSISLPMEEALSKALSSVRFPVVVADQSDNTGGGAPGDSTFVLRWLLEHDVRDAAVAIFYDPEVVRIANKGSSGAMLSLRLGGKIGPSSGAPLDVRATVLARRSRYMHSLPQLRGDPWLFEAGDVVALRFEDIDVVVSSERCQCFSPSIFTDLGIDPTKKRLLIPKSYQHFQRAFAEIADEIIYMAAPGAVPPDPRQIPYTRLDTSGLYPWIENPLMEFV